MSDIDPDDPGDPGFVEFYDLRTPEGRRLTLDSFRSHLRYHRKHLVRWVRERTLLTDKSYSDAPEGKLIWIDPTAVTNETRTKMGTVLDEANVVYGGRWDKAILPFRSRFQVRSMFRHFEDGIPWEETKQYLEVRSKLRRGQEWRGCTTEKELLEYLQRYDRLFEKIRKEGYKSQAELLDKEPSVTKSQNRDAKRPRLNEIGVNIGRNGELYWQFKGQHRLCLAQLLKLDSVPAVVVARHKRWQQIRNEIRDADDVEDLSDRARRHLGHPDLDDITPVSGTTTDRGRGRPDQVE